MNARRSFLAACLAATAGAWALPALAQARPGAVPVRGQLLSRNRNGPVPGVTVYLIHQQLGRSAPAITDAGGRFGWVAIPVRPDPYFLEVYWGQNLVLRQQVAVTASLQIAPLYL
jgi:hypothetical protein